MKIREEDWLNYFNVLTLGDRKYWEIPQLICVKCRSVTFIHISHDPEVMEIVKCNCDVDE